MADTTLMTLTDDDIIVTRLAAPRSGTVGGKSASLTADPDGSDGGDSDGTDLTA